MFALAAVQRPAEGGYFYAMHVASLCSRDSMTNSQLAKRSVDEALARDRTVSTAQLAALQHVSSLCASFGARGAGEFYRATKMRSVDGLDPLVNATAAAAASLGSPAAAERALAVERLLKIGDPLVLSTDALLWRLMGYARDGTWWFDGQVYGEGSGADPSRLMYALQLALCEAGVPCELDDGRYLACAGSAACFNDNRALVANWYLEPSDPGGMGDIAELERRIRSAVAAGDARVFVR